MIIRLLSLLFAAAFTLLVSGCSETPVEAGTDMARAHLESGANPSPDEKARMQAEVNERVADYTIREAQEFMQAYLQTIMEEGPAMIRLQGKAMEVFGNTMQNQRD